MFWDRLPLIVGSYLKYIVANLKINYDMNVLFYGLNFSLPSMLHTEITFFLASLCVCVCETMKPLYRFSRFLMRGPV